MQSEKTKTYVGAPVLRQEDFRLLTGKGIYIDDVPEPEGALHLAFVRSPHAHARILSIDVEEALGMPGVKAVYTGADIARLANPVPSPTLPGGPQMMRPHMAIDIARYVGETVAVVVAESPYLAEDAAATIYADMEELPTVLDVDQAAAEDAPLVHDYLPDNRVFRLSDSIDGTEEVFAKAPHVLGDTFTSGRVSAVAMETRGFLTRFDTGRGLLDHISSAQFPHKMRWEICQSLSLPEKSVMVSAPQVGGSFGMKGPTHSEDIVGAVIARDMKRPIKWIQDRQEDLTLMHGRDFNFHVEIACDDAGTLLGVRIHSRVDIGAYALWGATTGLDAGGAAHHMMGPYRCSHYAYEVASYVTNKTPTCSYRGVAAPINVLAMETLMERMAAKLGISPVEIRKRNLIRSDDLPYTNAVRITHDTASHIDCLERALDIVGYDAFKKEQSGRLCSDGKYRGIGIATITDHTGQGTSIARSRGQASRWPGYDGATVKMEPDGKVVAYASFASQGQGHQTVFAQVIADALSLPIEDVTIAQSDTNTMPFGTGAGASRAAVAGGNAVLKAGATLAGKIRRIAAHILECPLEKVVLSDGKASVSGTNLFVDFSEIASTAYMIGPGNLPAGETIGLEATEYYDPTTSVYSNATHAVCLSVDAGTGQVEIEKYVVVHDCGRMLNPLIVQGQVVGAIIQGVGSVLTEAVRYSDSGQPVATTLLDYGIPTFLDAPAITLDHIETPSTHNPAGLKGAGEGGIVGAVPAISLALTDALSSFGASFSHVPIMGDTLVQIMAREAAEAA